MDIKPAIQIYRCADCRRTVSTDKNFTMQCPKCSSRKTIPANHVTLLERISLFVATGIWFLNPPKEKSQSIGSSDV